MRLTHTQQGCCWILPKTNSSPLSRPARHLPSSDSAEVMSRSNNHNSWVAANVLMNLSWDNAVLALSSQLRWEQWYWAGTYICLKLLGGYHSKIFAVINIRREPSLGAPRICPKKKVSFTVQDKSGRKPRPESVVPKRTRISIPRNKKLISYV